MRGYTFSDGTDRSRGRLDITYMSESNKYRVRVYRKGVRYYLGLHSTFELAMSAHEEFILRTDNGAALVEPERVVEPYSKEWFKLQSDIQRAEFARRYNKI